MMMINWISATLALYLAGHLVCFGVSRLIAGRYESYTLAHTALAFFLSWISLPIITAVAGASPSNFLGSRNFYLASFLGSALFLFMLRRKSETNKASGDGTTPLMGAAMLGKIKQIQELISAGANIDEADERGWTPLMYAASRNEVDAVEFLLRRGANLALRNNENQTAAEIAQSKENIEAAAALQNPSTIG